MHDRLSEKSNKNNNKQLPFYFAVATWHSF